MNGILKLLLAVHVFLYRFSGGRVGGTLGRNQILLLNTIGRRSGKRRTTPLVYLQDGDRYIVIASNGGADRHPGWYYNLKEQPDTVIEVLGEIIHVSAKEATTVERERLWQTVTAQHKQFADYQAKTDRTIPLIILTPTRQ